MILPALFASGFFAESTSRICIFWLEKCGSQIGGLISYPQSTFRTVLRTWFLARRGKGLASPAVSEPGNARERAGVALTLCADSPYDGFARLTPIRALHRSSASGEKQRERQEQNPDAQIGIIEPPAWVAPIRR